VIPSILSYGCLEASDTPRPLSRRAECDYAVTRLSGDGFQMTQGTLLVMPLFDAVIASEVLEHVIRRGRVMREVSRILKPGGLALIFVPDDCLGPMDEPEHVIKYDRASLRDFLGRLLEVVSLTSLRVPHVDASSLFAVCRKSDA
jgi:SAM-dependent methyltransferase